MCRRWLRGLGLSALALGLGLTTIPLPLADAAPARKLRVVLIPDAPHDVEGAKAYAAAIADVASGERSFQLEVGDPATLRGDASLAGVRAAFDQALADKSIDLIVTLGIIGSSEAVRRGALPKPVIAARVLDPELVGVPKSGDGSGVRNLSYVSDAAALARDLTTARDLGFKRVHILVGAKALAALPTLSKVTERAVAVGLTASVVAVDAAKPAAALGGEVDGAILFGIDELPPPAVRELLEGARQKKLKTFSTRGAPDVRAGAAAGLVDAKDEEQRARRVAINVVRIAGGEAAQNIPVAYGRSETLTINQSVAQAIGWAPPYALLAEADTVGDSTPAGGTKVSLRGVAEEVAEKNLDFEVSRLRMEAQNEDQEKAVSLLLPQLDLSLRGVAIDSARAEASFGLQPQRQLLAVLDAKAVLFSDKAWANLSIQERLVAVRSAQREATRLDLVLEGARTYLGVLQTKILENVRTENAKKTRTNLGHARTRKNLGSAMPTEVLRWESQLAIDRREVLKARATRRLAEMQLNRLRHRPLEEPLAIEAEVLDAELKNMSPDAFAAHLEDARSFAALREFLVEEGRANAPELAALDSAVLAEERSVSMAWRTVFLPTFALAGQATYNIVRDGKGAQPPTIPSDIPPMFIPILENVVPEPIPNLVWQVAAIASLPIPLDLAPFSDIRRAEASLSARQLERDAVREKIEQRIRSAAYQVGASYPSVQLAQMSAEAARKNLGVVEEAYATGAVGVLDLLDAQNLALVAEQSAVGAQYEFMIDLLTLERAVGAFYFLKEKEDRDAWLARFVQYLEKNR